MKMQGFTTDFFDSNIYLLETNGHKIMIDAGGTPEFIKSLLQKQTFVPDYVLLTHGHIDHILALEMLENAKIFIHKDDAHYLVDPNFNLSPRLIGHHFIFNDHVYDYEQLPNELGIDVIHVPGHSPGSVALLINNKLFTGDTLFCNGIGNTSFPGGDLNAELNSVKKLLSLPGDMLVYPGHGPSTTIASEQNSLF